MNRFDKVVELSRQGLKSMRQDPCHHFDWRIRRDIYRRLKQINPKRGAEAHARLAVLAAQRVLPIFATTFPEDNLPASLLSLAIQVLQGEVSSQSSLVEELLDEGYHATGIDNFTWRGRKVYNAEYAGNACYKALLEARGAQQLLEVIENDGQYTRMFLNTRAGREPIITDEHIAHLAAFSDTASSAAIAYACKPDRFILMGDRLHAFWEWWAVSALPDAWEKAST